MRLLALFSFASLLVAAADPVARWWSHVEALSNDKLEGRDTGSEGYKTAARYVVAQFEKNGLQAAGENGGYYQAVPLHEVKLQAQQSAVVVVRNDGSKHSLRWLYDLTLVPQASMPASVEAPLVFGTPDGFDLAGKILVQLGAPAGTTRAAALPQGLAGVITIDSTEGPEPRHWPASYAVSMTLAGTPSPGGSGLLNLRMNPESADELFAGSGHTLAEVKAAVAAHKPLSFAIPAKLQLAMKITSRDLSSDNIIASLPGSELPNEYVVVSAHLDGYGVGEPRNGDRIYNGAFDDAAYVATLIDLAENIKAGKLKLRRSLLFVVVTAEEKGLLGSRYFAAHPTIAKEKMVGNVNLDQLRPIFPLRTLTALALDDSTLGDTARQVGQSMNIRIQPDPEPERNLLRRSDHFSFMQIGVPAIGFIFGYEKGSPDEATYRQWYDLRYHSPADDLKQPWDRTAAAKFNSFFDQLVITLANADDRPRWKPGSKLAPKL